MKFPFYSAEDFLSDLALILKDYYCGTFLFDGENISYFMDREQILITARVVYAEIGD